MKMDDFFGDFDTDLDNQSVMDNGSYYNEYFDLFKLNQRQNFLMIVLCLDDSFMFRRLLLNLLHSPSPAALDGIQK